MAENLNYTPTSGRMDCPNKNSANCATYGRLYSWAVAMELASSYENTLFNMPNAKKKGICPTDWHLPSTDEWNALIAYVGSNPGTKLKATSGWPSGANGTDNYGFKALSAGYVKYQNINDDAVGFNTHGLWWTATEYNASRAYTKAMTNQEGVYQMGDENYDYSLDKRDQLSVRCIKD
jgi:uncharacterized protein (TIGR02145 family)